MADQVADAFRAASTARSTSASVAQATSARGSSVAGLMVLCCSPPCDCAHSPLMNRPYEGRMSTMSRDSGAGAYSNMASVQGEVVGTGIPAGGHLLALHEQVVQDR